MKITKIEIKNYHQFKNFSIDLTYPQGHSKAGKPLDKICFIGQSGTGKSTIIELIYKKLINNNTEHAKIEFFEKNNSNSGFEFFYFDESLTDYYKPKKPFFPTISENIKQEIFFEKIRKFKTTN